MTDETPPDSFDHPPMFSRGGTTALGKCTAVLKTNVPEDTDLAFRALANKAGCTASELLRDLVCLVVHDQTFGEITADQRRKLLNVTGPEKGLLQRFFRPTKDE